MPVSASASARASSWRLNIEGGTRRRSSTRVDLAPLVEELPAEGAAALFCVERDPEACHGSIVAERLAAEHGVVVLHLRP